MLIDRFKMRVAFFPLKMCDIFVLCSFFWVHFLSIQFKQMMYRTKQLSRYYSQPMAPSSPFLNKLFESFTYSFLLSEFCLAKQKRR
jgi:hypothetical protein